VAQKPLVNWLILGQVAAVPNVWSQEHLSFSSWHCDQFFSGFLGPGIVGQLYFAEL